MSWKRGLIFLFSDEDRTDKGVSEVFRFNPDTHEVAISQKMDGCSYDVVVGADQLRRLVAELKKQGVYL